MGDYKQNRNQQKLMIPHSITSGQLRPTPLQLLYRTAGIAPPQTRREIQARTHKHSQENDKRHPMFDHKYPQSRLKSRKSFRTVESLDPNLSAFWRRKAWNELEIYPNEAIQPLIEELPTGTDLQRKDWVSLNRARAKVVKDGQYHAQVEARTF